MTLEQAEWPQVLGILHETFHIWSAGLSATDYHHYIWRQMVHPWSRSHYRYLIYRHKSKVVSSCKLYTLNCQSRGRDFTLAGIGAVYTPTALRGFDYAGKMLSELIRHSQKRYDGLLLFSDIGTGFYERLGFQPLPAFDFQIDLTPGRTTQSFSSQIEEAGDLDVLRLEIEPLSPSHIPFLNRHHIRWLRRQPYGIQRSYQYWHYKLWKEKYLHDRSSLDWPGLQLLTLPELGHQDCYAIIETSQSTLRILEIVGPPRSGLNLWKHILALALKRDLSRIRGWQHAYQFELRTEQRPRGWGHPMILPGHHHIQKLLDHPDCSFLELDHL